MCLHTLNITSFMLPHTSNQTCSAFSKTSAQTHLHLLPRAIFLCLANTRRTTVTHTCINSLCTLSSAHTQTHTNAHTRANLKIHPERLLCGIQSQCSWLESLSTASDVTSARSVSCSPPPSPNSLPLSYPLSSAEPIFWHFRRCSSHACHLSPPPPTLSSQLSIESMRLCLKLMYFVELTLWRLHHLEVGKWYWAERPIFSV